MCIRDRFTNVLSAVLAAAAAITVAIGDVKDAIVIGVVLVVNGIVGFIQEGRAERAVPGSAGRHGAGDSGGWTRARGHRDSRVWRGRPGRSAASGGVRAADSR